MKTFEILRIIQFDKWFELWVKEVNTDTDDDYNFPIQNYILNAAFIKTFPDIDIYAELNQKGINYYVGFKIQITNKTDTEVTFVS